VREETGIKAEIVRKIDFVVKYKYLKEVAQVAQVTQVAQANKQNIKGILVDKTVEFYLMKYVSGDTKDHSWEMEEVRWVEYEEAIKLLGFEGEKEVLKEARRSVGY